MARLQWYTDTVAVGASHSAGINLGNGEFQRFVIYFGSTFQSKFTSAAFDIKPQGSYDGGTTYVDIGYSNSPASATTGYVLADIPRSCTTGGAVICEAYAFADYARLKMSVAATQVATFYVGAIKN